MEKGIGIRRKNRIAALLSGGAGKWLYAAAGAYAGTWVCVSAQKMPDGVTAANSAFPVLLFLLLLPVCLLAQRGRPYPAKTWGCAGAGAVFLGVCSQWGKQLDMTGNVNFTAPVTWLAGVGGLFSAAPLLALGFTRLREWEEKRGRNGAAASGGLPDGAKEKDWPRYFRSVWSRLQERHRLLLTAAGLFLCWVPVFLAVFPGFFAYDATEELTEVLSGGYVTRHPLLHVLILGKTVSGVQKLTGSYNAGIAVYVTVQMAAMALLFAWALRSLRRLGAGKIICAGGFLFLALFPVIPMYVLCTSKDMPYTAGLLAVLIFLRRMVQNREEFFSGKSSLAGLGAALFVTAAFRNNGFIVFLMMIPALVFLAGTGFRKKAALTAAAVLAAYLGMNAGLNGMLHPMDTATAETFTVPIQQLARTFHYSPEAFSGEDRRTLLEILPEESLRLYTPKLSDPVKAGFVTENYEKDPQKYRSLWLRTGGKAPFTYLNAWFMTSYGFWYPDTVIDVYNGWRNYVESSYFSFETEEPGVRDSRFPWLEEQYRKLSWENAAQKIPVLSMLFSPGFLCWVWVLLGLFLLSAGRIRAFLSLLPVYLNLFTVLPGPACLVRYVLIFWFALPLLAAAVTAGEPARRV